MKVKKHCWSMMIIVPIIMLFCAIFYNLYSKETTTRVAGGVAKEVIIYTKAGCIYCTKAIDLMKREKIAYTQQDVTNDMDKRRSLVAITGANTVPYIFIDHKYIGGYTDFLSKLRNNELPNLKRSEE